MAEDVTFRELRSRLGRVAAIIVTTVAGGAAAYWAVGRHLGVPSSWLDCFYMSVLTLMTVGYGEMIPVAATPAGRLVSIGLMLGGVSALIYATTALAVTFIEGTLQGAWRRWRMDTTIAALKDHIVICGTGRVGDTIARELAEMRTPAVLVDMDTKHVRDLGEELSMPFVAGDATEEDVLQRAGLATATGLIAALGSDHENLFLVVTARSLRPDLRIVARGSTPSVVPKMTRAGADEIILPERIGGLRMASVMLRPTVVTFLDKMMRDRATAMRIEEVRVEPGSALEGKTLAEADLRARHRALVLAVERPDGSISYAPDADLRLAGGFVLVMLVGVEGLLSVRERAKA
ncbi:MAG: NAD-binding protein [Deltaproteobacteria bacterium]|nr:NAD-binding protein [Deltaproteobacteria bacterium]